MSEPKHVVEYDFPHARVTLTAMPPNGEKQDASIEIEVWPKSGQSAFAVIHAEHARAIAQQMIEMCDQLDALEEMENIIQLPLDRKPKGHAN